MEAASSSADADPQSLTPRAGRHVFTEPNTPDEDASPDTRVSFLDSNTALFVCLWLEENMNRQDLDTFMVLDVYKRLRPNRYHPFPTLRQMMEEVEAELKRGSSRLSAEELHERELSIAWAGANILLPKVQGSNARLSLPALNLQSRELEHCTQVAANSPPRADATASAVLAVIPATAAATAAATAVTTAAAVVGATAGASSPPTHPAAGLAKLDIGPCTTDQGRVRGCQPWNIGGLGKDLGGTRKGAARALSFITDVLDSSDQDNDQTVLPHWQFTLSSAFRSLPGTLSSYSLSDDGCDDDEDDDIAGVSESGDVSAVASTDQEDPGCEASDTAGCVGAVKSEEQLGPWDSASRTPASFELDFGWATDDAGTIGREVFLELSEVYDQLKTGHVSDVHVDHQSGRIAHTANSDIVHAQLEGAKVVAKVWNLSTLPVYSAITEVYNLQHLAGCPAAVQLRAFGCHQGEPVLLMEACKENLSQWRQRALRYPLEAIRMAAEATKQVVVLHEAGIAHLDIKLQNFLLDFAGRVKAADFGDSLLLPQSEVVTCIRGTEGYQCCEMLRVSPELPVDARKADVWSLGCCLFELIIGLPLFTNELEVLTILQGHRRASTSAMGQEPPAWMSARSVQALTQALDGCSGGGDSSGVSLAGWVMEVLRSIMVPQAERPSAAWLLQALQEPSV